jgi:cytochrome c peroxidase
MRQRHPQRRPGRNRLRHTEQQPAVTTIAINAGKTIAAYERQLSCGAGRFDAFMHGDKTALSESEQRGAALFVGKGKCANCHSGPFFSDQKFHNVGLFPARVSAAFLRNNDRGAEKGFAQVLADPLNVRGEFSAGDDGRLPSSVAPEMLGAFRTPMLRCSSTRPSFMHTGQFRTLEEVVAFFNQGGHKQPGVPAADIIGFLGETVIAPLGLTAQEEADLVAFLKSLDGPGPAANLLQAP